MQKTNRTVGTARNESELNILLKAAEHLKHEFENSRRGGVLFDDYDSGKLRVLAHS